ncbi:MAG: response regulator transcription factor [Candidatus Eremiobacteraeota bacterium]|nr:response regulator transcription factor [Candidatus Eremiobacteraeota bacterium]MBV9264318.1 response regulator transcription factor [Candidatus Eremiobacteraeota bacterium]
MTQERARVRVVIVEDHALTRAGLRTSLQSAYDVVAEAADGLLGWEAIQAERPEVAVIDIGIPALDGIALTQRVRAELPATHVVIVTMIDLEEEVLAALAAGADAYCLKNSDPQRIVEAVRIAADGGAYFDPGIAHVVLRRFSGRPNDRHDSPLTPRETEILRLISEGSGNAEIAEGLHIGLGTVKGHIRDILEKLSAADRTQAAVAALRKGYI